MDKSDFSFVCECNGFEIRQNPTTWAYRIFHPNFDGVYIVDYETLADAEKFCKEEDAHSWKETISEG